MLPIPIRYLKAVGTVAYLRCYVLTPQAPCPTRGYHDGRIELARTHSLAEDAIVARAQDYSPSQYPQQCDCGYVFDDTAHRHIFQVTLYATEDGTEVAKDHLAPGDLFFEDEHAPNERCSCGWTNCDGHHLHCILPGGRRWDIDSRANNCTLREDTLHRCWIRHGDPRQGQLHVDKQGLTCQAGAGSIVVPGFHGFLHHNQIVSC